MKSKKASPKFLLISGQKGFTLIEVMIALAVVAIALAGLSQVSGNFLWQQTALEQRVYANWLAQNEVVKLHTGLLAHPRASAEDTAMGHRWRITSQTRPTEIPIIVQLEVSVTPEGEKTPSATLTTIWQAP